MRLLTVSGIVTLLLLAVMSLYGMRAGVSARHAEAEDMRLHYLSRQIALFDEMLTMSARTGAATGDPRWEERYNQTAPRLDSAIIEVRQLAGSKEVVSAIGVTDIANVRLIALETLAFRLAGEGHRDSALAILLGGDYTALKGQYADGMTSLSAGIARHTADAGRMRSARMLFMTAAAVVTLLLVWLGALLTTRRFLAEQRRIQAVLHDSEGRLRSITGAAKDAILMMDDAGLVTFWNPAAEAMFGYAAGEVLGRNLHGFLPPERFRAAHAAAFDRFRATGEGGAVGKTLELSALHSDGHEIPVELSLSALQIGGRWHAVGLVRDITERKLAEKERAESEARFRAVFDNASEGMVLFEPATGKFMMVNRSCLSMMGYAEREFMNLGVPDLIPAATLPMVLEQIGRFLRGEPVVRNDILFRRRDGSVFFTDVSPARVRVGEVDCILLSFTDITERKRAEDALALKNAELAALNEQKNQFLGMAAHDLRNPLAVIMARSDFVLDGLAGALTSEQEKFIAAVKRSSEFMLKLVTDLLDVAKIESGKVNLELEPTDLAGMLRENVALNQVIAGKREIRLELEMAADLPKLELDRSKVEQVLNNLVSNAVKFSGHGDVVRIRAARMNDTVTVSVADCGPGIAPDEMNKLFKPFGRASIRSQSGEKDTGLGLVIVKRILEAHGGGIRVESEVGKGTTFYADLPAGKSE